MEQATQTPEARISLERYEIQCRNALTISRTTAAVMAVAFVVLTGYYAAIDAPGYRYSTAGLAFLVMFAGLISAWFCSRKKHKIGVNILLGSLVLAALALPFVVGGQGLQLGLMTIFLFLGVASFTLSGKKATIVVILGILLGIYNVLMDFFGPELAPIGNSLVTTGITTAVILVFAIMMLRRYRQFSLRTKLVVAFVLVSLVPLIILNLVSTRRLTNQLQEETERELVSASQQVKTVLDTFINDQLNLVYSEAQLPEIRDYLGLSPEQRPESEIEARTREVLTILQRKKSSLIRSYALLDLNGRNILDTEKANIGRDESDWPYFSVPVDSGLPYISEVFFNQQSPDVFFSSAVWDKTGQIIGILRVQFNAQILYNTVMSAANQFNAPEMYAVLVDNRYYIRYAHSRDYGLMYKSYDNLAPDVVTRLQQERRLPGGDVDDLVTNQADLIGWLQRLDQEPIFTGSAAALGGKPAISTAARLQRAPWIVITRQPMDVVLQPVQQQTRLSVLLSMLTALLVAGAALGATQLLSAPIVHLTKVAEEVAQGNLSRRAMVEADDEIGALAVTFNSMTDELQQTLQGLEQRVAARTRAIELSADVSRRLSNILELPQLVAEVVEQVQSAFDYYHVQIYLFDDQREYLELAGGTGEAGKEMLRRGHKLSKGQGLVGRSCDTGTIVLVQDTHLDINWLPNPLLPETKSEIAVPIILGDQVIGALDVQQAEVNGLGQQDADLLASVANQVAIALRNARQFEQIQRNAERQIRLNSIVQQIQSTQDVESALQVAVREIGRALNVQRTKARIVLNKNDDGDF